MKSGLPPLRCPGIRERRGQATLSDPEHAKIIDSFGRARNESFKAEMNFDLQKKLKEKKGRGRQDIEFFEEPKSNAGLH